MYKRQAEHNMAFRGSNDQLYNHSNGNFLGLVQLLASFDPVLKDHLLRAVATPNSAHYMSKRIQNEIINLLAVRRKILEEKKSKVLLDFTRLHP